MAPSTSSPPLDVPFIVRDRRRKGFFTIDNDLLDRYGDQLGPYGLAVYMALARFANQEGNCWPSLATIAKRTGMSRMQVIREIAKLQDLHLIAVEHQCSEKGIHRANLYILLDLPGVVTPSDQGSNSQLLGVVTPSDHPSHQELPKQNIEKKTQHRNNTQRTTRTIDPDNTNSSGQTTAPPVVVALPPVSSSSGSLEKTPRKKAVKTDVAPSSVDHSPPPSSDGPPSPTGASALIALGITPKVAQRLAQRYNLARIEEKLAYLDFLQAEQPDKVKNPHGWLRKAIEEDYAAPDGFVPKAEREAGGYGRAAYLSPMQLERHQYAQGEPGAVDDGGVYTREDGAGTPSD